MGKASREGPRFPDSTKTAPWLKTKIREQGQDPGKVHRPRAWVVVWTDGTWTQPQGSPHTARTPSIALSVILARNQQRGLERRTAPSAPQMMEENVLTRTHPSGSRQVSSERDPDALASRCPSSLSFSYRIVVFVGNLCRDRHLPHGG